MRPAPLPLNAFHLLSPDPPHPLISSLPILLVSHINHASPGAAMRTDKHCREGRHALVAMSLGWALPAPLATETSNSCILVLSWFTPSDVAAEAALFEDTTDQFTSMVLQGV